MTSSPHMYGWALLKNLLYVPAAFLLGISSESYAILTVFLFADLLIGVLRVALIDGPQHVKSYKFTAGLISKMLVLSIPLVLVWAGRGAGLDLTFLGQWSVGVLVLAQAYSILGHINSLRVGEDRSEWDAVAVIQRRLRSALEALLVDAHNKP